MFSIISEYNYSHSYVVHVFIFIYVCKRSMQSAHEQRTEARLKPCNNLHFIYCTFTHRPYTRPCFGLNIALSSTTSCIRLRRTSPRVLSPHLASYPSIFYLSIRLIISSHTFFFKTGIRKNQLHTNFKTATLRSTSLVVSILVINFSKKIGD